MDAAFVSEFTGGRQMFRAAAGDPQAFGIEVGTGPKLDETYCQHMVAGAGASVVPDVGANERASRWRATRAMGIAAYVGVPLFLPDGSVFGTLCCVSRRADPSLRERDARYLRMIADILMESLQRRGERQRAMSRIDTMLRDRGQLEIALQPITELHDGRVTAVEALARFPGRTGSPDAVFADACAVGRRAELELRAIDRALAVVPDLPADCRLAVNVSPEVVLLDSFTAMLTASGTPLARVVVELTEHAEVDSYGAVLEVLAPLRARGLSLAVDDAGAGFASFAHVLALRPDIVKLDRSLLLGLEATDPAARKLFTAFVDLACSVGASVTAEGVETAEQLALLRSAGVRHAQGFLLGRPTVDRTIWRTWWEPGRTERNHRPAR